MAAVILTAFALQAGAQTRAAPDSGRGPVAEPLAPGDAIQLSFWRDPQFNGDYSVDETGMVVLPFLGVRRVTNTPSSELKRQLLDDYAQQLRNQDVRVTLLRRVRILGAVKNPGLYRVEPTMTLGDAVAVAGGPTPEGKLKGIRILRNGQEIRSNLDGRTRLAEYVRSGDQIMVPERGWFARNGFYIVAAAGISTLGAIIAHKVGAF
jgi:protein involved in polysaccharide export with SLBB domain